MPRTSRVKREWLDDLTDVAYDAEDVIYEFATEASRWKLEEARQPAESQVWNLIPTSLSPSVFVFNFGIKSKISVITESFEDIAKQQHDLGLRVGVKERSYGFKERLPTTSLVNESFVYGRDKEKGEIIDLLLSEEPCDNETVPLIPIVGMGGVGKTTLAQLAYNDDRVRGHFDMKAWVCVSDEVGMSRITLAILESATRKSYGFKYLEPLQDSLRNVLKGKKFLLVLDDVWDKNYIHWDLLRKPFSAGAKGSKIIVTTRSKDVASIMAGRSVPIHYLKHLSYDDCWSLFQKHAFDNTNTGHQPKLESIGRQIVKKCKGSPLAAKTLGGLLRCKEEDEWEYILNSELWDLSDEESDIIPALKLSYLHLPAHLKRCFAYCAIFPKDYEFEQENLVLLWMAEGFLKPSRRGKEMEDLGREYFAELLSRSLFQQSSGAGGRFVMHDLINDLAQCVAGDICLKLADDRQNGNLERARHLSFDRKEYYDIEKFEVFSKVKGLRTVLSLPIHSRSFFPS